MGGTNTDLGTNGTPVGGSMRFALRAEPTTTTGDIQFTSTAEVLIAGGHRSGDAGGSPRRLVI